MTCSMRRQWRSSIRHTDLRVNYQILECSRTSIRYTGLLLRNRLIWVSAGASIFAFAYAHFRMEGKNARVEDIGLRQLNDS